MQISLKIPARAVKRGI